MTVIPVWSPKKTIRFADDFTPDALSGTAGGGLKSFYVQASAMRILEKSQIALLEEPK
jgi:hypothetical protein